MLNTESFVRLILPALAGLATWLLMRKSGSKQPKLTAKQALSVLFGDTPLDLEARRLMEEQFRRIRRARIWSRVVAVLVIVYGVLVPLPQVLALPSGFQQQTAFGMLIALLGAIYTVVVRITEGRYLIQPRIVLVLRRFRKRQWRYGVVLDYLKFGCLGLAVPITIQDSSFRGNLPISLELVQYLLLPALCFALVISTPFLNVPFPLMLTLWVGGCAAIISIGYSLLRRIAVYSSGPSGYQQMLTKMFLKIRRRRLLYSGTQVMKFPNAVWQNAIEMSIREADAVVIDISEISDAVAWEINTVRELMPSQRVIFIWSDARSEKERVRELQTRHLRRIFAQPQESRIPQSIREVLYKIVPADWVARCSTLPYVRSRKRYTNTFFASELAQLLVRSFAYGSLSDRIDRIVELSEL
jgi:hypothetical protein